MRVLRLLPLLAMFAMSVSSISALADTEKEWTVLVFLNGHNNLSSFGKTDINEMEKVGSTDQVNVVVQWASTSNSDTRRLYIQKDTDANNVTSPVIESLPRVDMGNYKNLVEFVAWAAQKYPAKKYFVTAWNHGSGWHRELARLSRDISWDDYTGNKITTEELGMAMREIAQITGRKVEVYGSDACLMNMVEVGAEMADSVNYMVGSEEVEPGPGWAYDGWLAALTANPMVDGAEAGRVLAETYLASYSGGTQGTRSVQLSVLNLNQSQAMYDTMAMLSREITALDDAGTALVKKSSKETLRFYYSDYADIGDFVRNLALNQALGAATTTSANEAVASYVVANYASKGYSKSTGAAVWLPYSLNNLNTYKERYSKLQFNLATQWLNVLEKLNPTPVPAQ